MTKRKPSVPTLYEWLGDAAALERLMTCFYERVRQSAMPDDGGINVELRMDCRPYYGRRASIRAKQDRAVNRLRL
jgi:hypothetical protein